MIDKLTCPTSMIYNKIDEDENDYPNAALIDAKRTREIIEKLSAGRKSDAGPGHGFLFPKN